MVRSMKRNSGFTLVELIIVIAIIGLLAGMLLPALHRARMRARRTKCKTEVKQIEMAWKSYLNDYRELPSSSPITMGPTAIQILKGQNTYKYKYLEFKPGVTEMQDPWYNVYKMALDDDLDDAVETPHGTVYRNVAVWSTGPDGADDSSGARDDDVTSWSKN